MMAIHKLTEAEELKLRNTEGFSHYFEPMVHGMLEFHIEHQVFHNRLLRSIETELLNTVNKKQRKKLIERVSSINNILIDIQSRIDRCSQIKLNL
jgi:HD superfamily phosphohydrolase